MVIVIIAGGSGTRLWPLSTPEYPKHLLRVGSDKKTILQNTYMRAKKLTDKVYVVSDKSHIAHVKGQLDELSEDAFITEPARRGTANCILAALVKLKPGIDIHEPIAFIHADHFIRDIDGFIKSFMLAIETMIRTKSIVLIGIEPSHPATGFGYIKKGEPVGTLSNVNRVDGFMEKPNYKKAQKFLKEGLYLWNCGYFVGSVSAFEIAMKQYAPSLFSDYQKLNNLQASFKAVYLGLKSQAIDYALIERVKNLYVVQASFDWMDIGSFYDLAQAVDCDEEGNYVSGQVIAHAVSNSYIENHEDKPLAIIGLDNVAVINTKQGILVVRKDMSQKVGDIAKSLY